MAIGILQYFRF